MTETPPHSPQATLPAIKFFKDAVEDILTGRKTLEPRPRSLSWIRRLEKAGQASFTHGPRFGAPTVFAIARIIDIAVRPFDSATPEDLIRIGYDWAGRSCEEFAAEYKNWFAKELAKGYTGGMDQVRGHRLMTQNMPLYEPRFYERAAQHHVAGLFPDPVFINVRWGLSGSLAIRHELDALVLRARQATPVEIKAHSLSSADTDEIVAKYRRVGFQRVMIVAPVMSIEAGRRLTGSRAPSVELILFHPDLEAIREWYCATWPHKVPAWTHAALASGRHHVRFVLSRPTNLGRFVIGQQRTRVYSTDTVLRLMTRLPAPPARILWTPQRFTTPRDLIAHRSRVTPIGGFVPIDIDGDRLHQARHACQISTSEEVCQFYMRYADAEYRSLVRQLDEKPVDVLTSGGRGIHVYYEDHGDVRERVVKLSRDRRIRLDENVTTALKSTVAPPGSLHASSMQPVESIMKATREVTPCL